MSKTSTRPGAWNIYTIDVTNDGTKRVASNPARISAIPAHRGRRQRVLHHDERLPWLHNGFAGAQIYALSKAQLAAGAASVTVEHIDTSGMVNAPSDAGSTQPGFTVWPAQSPGTQFDTDNGGTEFSMSSNAADEAQNPVSGNAGTTARTRSSSGPCRTRSSLNSSGPRSASERLVSVGTYGVPPKQ